MFPEGSKKKEPLNYEKGRTENDFVDYLNEHAGTHRLAGGGLSNSAGRIADLDEWARKVSAVPEEEKSSIYSELQQVLAKLTSPYRTFFCLFNLSGTRNTMPKSLTNSKWTLSIHLKKNFDWKQSSQRERLQVTSMCLVGQANLCEGLIISRRALIFCRRSLVLKRVPNMKNYSVAASAET